MTVLPIRIDDDEFDRTVHGRPGDPSLQDKGDLRMIVKQQATQEGRAAVVLAFTVILPDGSTATAQSVTTAATLVTALGALQGWIDGGHI